MENVRKRVDVRLCNNGSKAEKKPISKPNFKDRTIYSETLVAFHMSKTVLTLNKPIVVGMSILDISKRLMYRFHVEIMRETYHENAMLLYMNTNSFSYNIQCQNVYNDMKNIIQEFDTYEYPENNIFGIPAINKNVPGKFKDENNGKIMTEFIGLRF
ncbi:hypothetical protein AVEN_19179-1 [Araneus ventricosus]|uniref:Uncharacterized protein n=1 Tax=Araneus ventricosus TaxID=182803 RepID=A0A4Y2WKT1_ARAVE|nr:hypothetical protein AVEN_19179-1 [Araneus ventricosus]